ncbi:glycosyltransferase [bacterium]|nr:glycosyltransferase [bacterium]
MDIYIYDDNSQDDTLEIIDNYIINNKDMNIKVIKNNLNQGVVLARINLLKRINDDYAIFIDQDD